MSPQRFRRLYREYAPCFPAFREKSPARSSGAGFSFETGLPDHVMSIKCPYGYTLSAYTCLDTPTHTKMIILCEGGTSF